MFNIDHVVVVRSLSAATGFLLPYTQRLRRLSMPVNSGQLFRRLLVGLAPLRSGGTAREDLSVA